MSVLHVLLVVWVNPSAFLVSGLSSLQLSVLVLHTSMVLLKVSISQDLLTTNVFLLHGVSLILVYLLLLHEAGLLQLLGSLIVDVVDLTLIESLKVVWLDSVVSEHAHFSLRVLSHEVVGGGEGDLFLVEVSPIIVVVSISLSLLLGHLLVNFLCELLVVKPVLVVLTLSLSQNLVEVDGLLVELLVDESLVLFFVLLFPDLLFAPILLL